MPSATMSNSYQHIQFAVENRIARITLARPPLNILNIAMMDEIGQALSAVSGERDLVAIIFDAAPGCRAFSAGVAVEDHAEKTIYRMLDSFHAIFRHLEQLARPAIAIVDGPALGGGCELVTACDIVIASDKARFGQPEIKLGVFPPVAAILLPLVVGDKRARELILTGEIIDAEEARRCGLVSHVVPSSELPAKSAEITARLSELSSPALELTRRALDLGRGRSFETLLKQTEDLYLHELMKTEDATEGINAFQEKRKPVWRNR